MPELLLSDITLHYEICGAGPPLLLIPGMVSDSATWLPILPLLQDHFTLIRPDNRTTGRTRPWNAPVSIDHFAADCAVLLHHLDVGPAHVLGHSMGGLIGLRLAITQPEHVQSLTLAAAAPLRLERNIELFRNLLTIRISDAPEDTWLRALFPWLLLPSVWDTPGATDEALAAALAYPYAQTSEAMAQQIDAFSGYVPDNPARLTCPSMAILAQDDLLIPLLLAQEVLGAIPTKVVPNSGHSVHWDAPALTAAHFRQFITEITP